MANLSTCHIKPVPEISLWPLPIYPLSHAPFLYSFSLQLLSTLEYLIYSSTYEYQGPSTSNPSPNKLLQCFPFTPFSYYDLFLKSNQWPEKLFSLSSSINTPKNFPSIFLDQRCYRLIILSLIFWSSFPFPFLSPFSHTFKPDAH